MAWEDELEPDWVYEMPFYLVATIAYGILITVNPTMRWGGGRPPEPSVPIEFVAAPPAPPPSPNLALPPVPGAGHVEPPPRKGSGDYVPEKVKTGAQDAPPKPLPKPKPAAVKSTREKHGATLSKAKAKAKRVVARAVRTAPKPNPVDMKAIMAASVARRAKVEHVKEAKAAAEARAEAARVKAEAARERAQALADAKAAKARKKAELSQQLATMNDPDEALAQDADSPPPPSTGHAKIKGATKAGAAAALAGARKAGAAAALADTAESGDPGDTAGSGGADVLDAKAKGGGVGPDGSGVSYSVDGPVGNRRLLRRTVPVSPDWVGTRGLDLTVTVRFQVLPNGHVKRGAVIQKTSGFPEIDALALQAIRQWIFQAAASANGSDVWGRVTFHFTS